MDLGYFSSPVAAGDARQLDLQQAYHNYVSTRIFASRSSTQTSDSPKSRRRLAAMRVKLDAFTKVKRAIDEGG